MTTEPPAPGGGVRVLACAALLAALAPGLPAQDAPPRVSLKASFEPPRARPGAEVVFVLEARIDDGYHLYGPKETQNTPTRVVFERTAPLEPLGPVQYPKGRLHVDPFGGGSVWLEGKVVFRRRFAVPAGTPAGKVTLTGALDYAPCTENFCEAQQKLPFEAVLAVLPAAGDRAGPRGAERSGAAGAGAQAGPGPAQAQDEGGPETKVQIEAVAFEPAAAAPGARLRFVLRARTVPGWHVYGARDELGQPVAFSLDAPDWLVPAGSPRVPPGERHAMGGGLESYWISGPFELAQSYRLAAEAPAGKHEIEGTLRFIPCTPDYCLEAAELPFSVTLTVAAARSPASGGDAGERGRGGAETGGEAPKSGSAPAGRPAGGKGPSSAVDRPRSAAGGTEPGAPGAGSLLQLLLAAISAGLLALLMPCTYPMIPITFSFFTKQAEDRSGAVLPLALAYGFGIVAIFILIGVVVGGAIVGFAVHWATNLVIGLLFLVFAASLLGLFELRPPRFLLDAAGKASLKGGYAGVLLMGATLVVTSFTCTVPFVASILGVSARGGLGHVVLGMGAFGATMAAPFVLLALAPAKLSSLPRAGQWMHTLKVFLGFVEAAAALKFLSNVDLNLQLGLLPDELFLTLWAVIFLVAGLFLLGLIRMEGESGAIGPGRLAGGTLVLLLAGYFAYGALGNPYRNNVVMNGLLPGYRASEFGGGRIGAVPQDGAGAGSRLEPIVIADDFEAARAQALREGKLLLVNFTGFL